MLNRILYIGIILALVLVLTSCSDQPDRKVNFNGDWNYLLLDESNFPEDEFFMPEHDDSGWEPVQLPHTAHLEPLVVNNQWQGICWYRKNFTLPKSYIGKKVFLEFEGAMSSAKIWLNGVRISEHDGGYLPIVVDITDHLNPDSENIIAVRLDNTDNPNTGPKPLSILDFNMYGGLYRNVWLSAREKVYISHPVLAGKTAGGGVFITTPVVSEDKSVVEVKTHIVNEEKQAKSVELVQKVLFEGEVVEEQSSGISTIEAGEDLELTEQINITDPKLWSPSNPNLYHLETSLLVDGKMVEKNTTRFGIRELVFQGNELYINGVKTFLRGVNRHQEYPFIGYALSDNAQYRDAKKIKEAGFDYIRLSHYPHSPAFMDACDELGLLVLDAILGWQFYSDTEAFREYCYRSTRELILRDRNHPSVLAWEASLNETRMPLFFMEELHRIVHAEYPGKNVYSSGWMPEVYDIYLQARQHRIRHYEEVQLKPYSVSEYGDWEYYSNNPGLNQHKYSREVRYKTSSRQKRGYGEARLLQQASNIQEAHNDNFNTPAFGDSYWVMYDYNRGYHDDIEFSGIMDIFRLPKFAYYFYKSQRDPEVDKVVHIASWWTPESPLDLKVFSNCDEVELYINDRLLAKHKPDTGINTENLAHPPFTFNLDEFEAGTLRAVGLINGQEVQEHIVKTPLKATGLKVWLDESGRAPEANCNDVLFLYIAAVDKNGTIVPDYSDVINLDFEGDVSVMNVVDIEAEAGIATALIKIGSGKDDIKITAHSEDLETGEIRFPVLLK